ncbi:MAG: 3-keto-5-aminohexanoate cleavage protein [Hyphomicrobiales bacterium]
MLQACLNGGRTKSENTAVPVTPEELAANALAAKSAGADELHIHPRDEAGAESLAPDDVAAALNAVRDAVPGMPVGVGSGEWIAPGKYARLELMLEWEVLPDYASVNLNEETALDTMELLAAQDIGIEAGIWVEDDAELFVKSPFKNKCLRVLLEMPSGDAEMDLATYPRTIKILQDAGVVGPFLLHGLDGSKWTMVRQAFADGLDTRVGFEDSVFMPSGMPAESNAEIIEAARALKDTLYANK